MRDRRASEPDRRQPDREWRSEPWLIARSSVPLLEELRKKDDSSMATGAAMTPAGEFERLACDELGEKQQKIE